MLYPSTYEPLATSRRCAMLTVFKGGEQPLVAIFELFPGKYVPNAVNPYGSRRNIDQKPHQKTMGLDWIRV